MRAISIMQPWLFAICRLNKRIENRTWAPGRFVIGRQVALHAGRKEDKAVLAQDSAYSAGTGPGSFSAIIGVATVSEVVLTFERARELGQERWWVQRANNVGHLFSGIVELPRPIAGVKGNLGYWEIPTEIQQQVRAQLGELVLPESAQ